MTDGDVVVKHFGDTYKVAIPSVEDVEKAYDPPVAAFCENSDKGQEVVAIGTAVYMAVYPEAYDSHRRLVAYTGWDVGPNNLWILPSKERLAYPYSVLYAIASLFKTEKLMKREADWFFWHDDDVIMPANTIRTLRESADPEKRPFVAAVGYDRNPEYLAAVWELLEPPDGPKWYKQWEDSKPSGVHRVATTGLCAALFHRSFFRRVPQPWFVSIPPHVSESGSLDHKVNTDGWLSQQCHDHDMPIYVNCDVKLVHMGHRIPVGEQSAKTLRKAFPKAPK